MGHLRRIWRSRLISTLTLGSLALANIASASTATAGAVSPIRFAPTASYRTGPSPQQVAVADFDGDGHLDMVTVNWGSNTVSFLPGRGDGTFGRPVSITAGIARPLALATADMDGDGIPDLVVVNGRRTDGVAVLLGDGTGGFSSVTYPGGHRSQWVIAADLDGDGAVDVATANARGGVTVLRGNGDGSLGPDLEVSTRSTMCSSLTAADLNGDGVLDLVTTNSVLGNGMSNHSISVLLGEGDGTFGRADVYRHLGYQPTMATTADLNGDGAVDLASSGLGTSYVVPTNQGIAIRAGNGNGTFQQIQRITDAWPSGTWAWPTWIGAADLNGDGRIDLFAPDELNDTVGVLINVS